MAANAVTTFVASHRQQLYEVAAKERVGSHNCVTRHTTFALKEGDLAGLHTSCEQWSALVTNWRHAVEFQHSVKVL